MKATVVNDNGVVMTHDVVSVVFTGSMVRLNFKLPCLPSEVPDMATEILVPLSMIVSLVIEDE